MTEADDRPFCAQKSPAEIAKCCTSSSSRRSVAVAKTDQGIECSNPCLSRAEDRRRAVNIRWLPSQADLAASAGMNYSLPVMLLCTLLGYSVVRGKEGTSAGH
jgi:hypothetical protein